MSSGQPSPELPRRSVSTAQKQLVGFIVVVAVVCIAYRLVYANGWSQTAALYIGVPTLLAVGLALLPRSKSATGMLVKGATVAILIGVVILPEGVICLLFALPLVLLIALTVGGAIDWSRRNQRREGPTLMAVTLPLLVLSLEGLVGTPFDTHDSAASTITVNASPAQVRAALAATPTFRTGMPPFLSLGFNRPIGATGAGDEVGDARMIEFTGGTHDDHPLRLFGLTGQRSVDHHSHMRLTVTESAPGRLIFRVDQDTTMLGRWVDLQRAVVTWNAIDETTTRVTWRLEYERLLYPTAYFDPLQGYGMGQAAGYLLQAVVADSLR